MSLEESEPDYQDIIISTNDPLLRDFKEAHTYDFDVVKDATGKSLEQYQYKFSELSQKLIKNEKTPPNKLKPWHFIHLYWLNIFDSYNKLSVEDLKNKSVPFDLREKQLAFDLREKQLVDWEQKYRELKGVGDECKNIIELLTEVAEYRYLTAYNDLHIPQQHMVEPEFHLPNYMCPQHLGSIHNDDIYRLWEKIVLREEYCHPIRKRFFGVGIEQLESLQEAEQKIQQALEFEPADNFSVSTSLSKNYFKNELYPNVQLCEILLSQIDDYGKNFKTNRNDQSNKIISELSELVNAICLVFEPYVYHMIIVKDNFKDSREYRSVRRIGEYIECMVFYSAIVFNTEQAKKWNKYADIYSKKFARIDQPENEWHDKFNLRDARNFANRSSNSSPPIPIHILEHDDGLGERLLAIQNWIVKHNLSTYIAANFLKGKVIKVSRFSINPEYTEDEKTSKVQCKSSWGELKIIIKQDDKFVIVVDRDLSEENKKNIRYGGKLLTGHTETVTKVEISVTTIFRLSAIKLPRVKGELLSVKAEYLFNALNTEKEDEAIDFRLELFFRPIRAFFFGMNSTCKQMQMPADGIVTDDYFKTSFRDEFDKDKEEIIDLILGDSHHYVCSTHIHGDEWGNNFIVFNDSLTPIDLEDVVFTDDDFKNLKTCGGMLGLRSFNKHRVDNQIVYKNQDEIFHSLYSKYKNFGHAPFNTFSSYGRLIAALLQKLEHAVDMKHMERFVKMAYSAKYLNQTDKLSKIDEQNKDSYELQIMLSAYDWICYWALKPKAKKKDRENKKRMRRIIENYLETKKIKNSNS